MVPGVVLNLLPQFWFVSEVLVNLEEIIILSQVPMQEQAWRVSINGTLCT